MARLRYRWLLPLGHALVDVIVLSHLIWLSYQCQPDRCRQPGVVRTEEGTAGWTISVVWDGGPEDFGFLLFGTLPAGVISNAARPEAGVQKCDRLWDPVWFSIHEAIALLFWFLLGEWLDAPGAPLRKLLGVYLGLRFAFALLCWLVEMPVLGTRVEMLFWLVFSICALVQGVFWLVRRFTKLHV